MKRGHSVGSEQSAKSAHSAPTALVSVRRRSGALQHARQQFATATDCRVMEAGHEDLGALLVYIDALLGELALALDELDARIACLGVGRAPTTP